MPMFYSEVIAVQDISRSETWKKGNFWVRLMLLVHALKKKPKALYGK